MDFVRIPHHRPAYQPIPPLHRVDARIPSNPHHGFARNPPKPPLSAVPKTIPILQPPAYSSRFTPVYEKENQNQRTLRNNDQNTEVKRKITIEIPVLTPRQNYPRQPLPARSVVPVRYAERKYRPELYFNHYAIVNEPISARRLVHVLVKLGKISKSTDQQQPTASPLMLPEDREVIDIMTQSRSIGAASSHIHSSIHPNSWY
ncbi:unnamed protein product [Rotaria socialis]